MGLIVWHQFRALLEDILDSTKANECMHCKHMGVEIRLNLHISFILVSLF